MPDSQAKSVKALAVTAIEIMQSYINNKGFSAAIHFELEGCFSSPQKNKSFTLNYDLINQQLSLLGVEGELIPEYWKNQWEYVSDFNGQLPLTEANHLEKVINVLPHLFAKQGISETHIKPVVWSGDKGKMAHESRSIFSDDNRDVHIPNAIQVNVSVTDTHGQNIMVKASFGEYLQQQLLESSLACALLYLPEEEAYERLSLKQRFGLNNELSSPNDISGGHQGSIALYKQWGKHNQSMGEEVLLYDIYKQPIVTHKNWEKTARIEHRLGASSTHYSPHVNVVYMLMNVITALDSYLAGTCESQRNIFEKKTLPESLYSQKNKMGAIDLFINSQWFNETLNGIIQRSDSSNDSSTYKLGDKLKGAILSQYLLSVVQ